MHLVTYLADIFCTCWMFEGDDDDNVGDHCWLWWIIKPPCFSHLNSTIFIEYLF